MAALNAPVRLKNVKIFADGDLGCAELLCQVDDQNAPVATQNVENMSPPLFVQHRSIRQALLSNRCFGHLLFTVSAWFLSTARGCNRPGLDVKSAAACKPVMGQPFAPGE